VRQENGSRTVTDGDVSFTIPNLDFNVRSFRSNAVVRWEWRRGSTLFLVWQQNRFARDPFGSSARPGDLWNALGERGQQYFAVKLNYWLPVD
jgi:hypothetical protein